MSTPYYVTTPIYYVNDRPHLGHLYTTTVADIIARFRRLKGDDVFFLTGVDEHATKVERSAPANGRSPRSWADEHAGVFRGVLAAFGISNEDFVRTSEPRHTAKVTEYVTRLNESGDVNQGHYEG
jgi:methionyl-tRNA synthetase